MSVPLGRLWGPADVLAQFLLQAALLLTLVLAAALLGRRRTPAALAAAALLAALVWIGPPHGLREASHTAGEGDVLRVLVANLHGSTGIPPIADLHAWLEASDADVVLLNEAAESVHRGLAAIATTFPHSAYCTGQLHCETLILSRRPLHAVAYHVSGRYGGKVMFAGVDVAGKRLNLALTHVMRPVPHGSPYRNFEQSRFVADMTTTRRRVVLAGDFNAVPWGRVLTMFERHAGLRGATLWQGTWPTWLPSPLRIHIDHVLVGCGVELRALRPLRFPRSDHLAVLASVAPSDDVDCEAEFRPPRSPGAGGR
ncbi:MAG: endonuclease/exonuclease/phosphatase family protein [Pseudomonadota bacterium]